MKSIRKADVKKIDSEPVDGVFQMMDKSGNYIVKRDSGFDSAKTNMIVKRAIFTVEDYEQDKFLEKSVTISTYGKLNDKTSVLRPERSQFTVWFEGQKYFSEISLLEEKRSLKVKLESNEPQWNKTEEIPFPKGSGVYCFFSQIVECARTTGFFQKAEKEVGSQMHFHIVWEGYPYIQEQYENIPNELFTSAQLVFEGKKSNGERRYSMIFAGQSIIFFVDKAGRFMKMFWIAQGMSMAPKLDAEVTEDEE